MSTSCLLERIDALVTVPRYSSKKPLASPACASYATAARGILVVLLFMSPRPVYEPLPITSPSHSSVPKFFMSPSWSTRIRAPLIPLFSARPVKLDVGPDEHANADQR